MSVILYLIWMSTYGLVLSQTPTCTQTGWFGSQCQYQCHCIAATCQTDGSCASGDSCSLGWFGPACQYVDLAINRTVETTGDKKINSNTFTDGNDDSCNTDTTFTSINLTLSQPYLVSWLRLQTKTAGYLQSVTVSFSRQGQAVTPSKTCVKSPINGGLIMDIFCDLNERVENVVLMGDGVTTLCSLYVSGGRNVALKQQATHINTFSINNASLAVDGETDGIFDHRSCAATRNAGDPNKPYWSVSLSNPATVSRYVLWNSIDNYPERLSGFLLESFTSNDSLIYRYRDGNNIPNKTENIVIPDNSSVSVSRVKITGALMNGILTLCEVQVFGDTECQAGKYGRECEHECNCADKNESCFASTGECPSGCADGYMGKDCTQPCDKGWFGSSCRFKCHCSDDKCQPIVNQCSSCKLGWFGPDCQYVDLMQTSNEHHTSPVKDISDNNDTTCLTNLNGQTVSITWNTSFHFMWLRIIVKDPGVLNSIVLNFNTSDLSCDNPRNASVNDRTLDVHCNLQGPIDEVTLTGSGISSLCSVYISGGRNVALHQATSQTSTYDAYGPAKAVDDETDGYFFNGKTCTATEETALPAWNITFLLPVKVVKYVLYNRLDDSFGSRLHGFLLTSYKAGDNISFSHTDEEQNVLPIYYVTPPSPSDSVTHISVKKAFPAPKDVITLCEFQVFGGKERNVVVNEESVDELMKCIKMN